MKEKDFTRRDFMKTVGTGVAAAGLVSQFPSLAFGAKNYTFGSASAKGSWYPLAVAMSKVINDNVKGYNVTGVTTPGASRENIMRIDRKEMELGWSVSNYLYKGFHGKEPFKKKNQVFGWFSAYSGFFTIVARKNAGIKTIADLKGKRVAIGTPGSHTQLDNSNLIFPSCGLTPGKDFKPEFIRFPDAVQKMTDGHIDACSYFMGLKGPGYIQMAESVALNFLSIPSDAEQRIRKQDPSYFIGDIPKGTYAGMKGPASTVGLSYCTICGSYLSDEFMYKATKAVFENLKFIVSSAAAFKQAQVATVYRGMPVPVHPGAARYYKEMGVTK
ncbi:MAG: TAXI family TRAP transporter solute-binding subunit [Desulfarculaceae bacterium]|nr:TAXI family TRAP transporter solute-binding subunit [Desulfarculaceae bacterium]MCF8073172.1 TAXI family TRAP transporter solute-binding subunit [Desulfarculaceae bacterium]MCF8100768.1 TAXI family TRAP transporter solute-binding subunit [Desulfarculaceae bacterium]MCF8118415.1 TAXI family TRAP transporter solute-binding subunit [Desulfarculaceae bacterium]